MSVRIESKATRDLQKQIEGLRQGLECAQRYGQPIASYVQAIATLETQLAGMRGNLRSTKVSRKDRMEIY